MREKGGEGSREGGGARGTRKPHRDGAESTAILIPWGIDGYYRRAAVAGGIGECQPPTLCATFVLAWCPHVREGHIPAASFPRVSGAPVPFQEKWNREGGPASCCTPPPS